MYNVVIVMGFCSVAIFLIAAEQAVANIRFSNPLILLTQSCEIVFLFLVFRKFCGWNII